MQAGVVEVVAIYSIALSIGVNQVVRESIERSRHFSVHNSCGWENANGNYTRYAIYLKLTSSSSLLGFKQYRNACKGLLYLHILSPFEHRIRPILGPIRKSNIFSVFAVYVTHKV